MSDDIKNYYNHEPSNNDNGITVTGMHFPYYHTSPSMYNPVSPLDQKNPRELDPFISFTDSLHGSMDYKTLSKAFENSCSPSQTPSAATCGEYVVGNAGIGNPSTPNSPCSSSSTEAIADDDLRKKTDHVVRGCRSIDDESQKGNKPKKKGEKGKKEPRFAFMTKSEIDHLEDGYRWRKYGQKAVKNSGFPRSYYRCTTINCSVKKRVERSYQDPSVVVTTYEGRHNHLYPSTPRRNATIMVSPPHLTTVPTNVAQELLMQMAPIFHPDDPRLMHYQTLTDPLQQLFVPDNGLLQDMVQSFPYKET